jgi:hypothetical protein
MYNRWSTVHIPNYLFCKLRFSLDPERDNVFYPQNLSNNGVIDIVGKVVDDELISFMPRIFKLKNGSGEIWTVMTVFWDYSFAVALDDVVRVTGYIDKQKKVIVIGDRKMHGISIKSQARCFCKVL